MQEGGLPRPPRPAWQLGWRSPLKIEQPDIMLTLREREPEVGPGVGGTVGKTLPRSPSSLLAQLQDICPQQQQLPGGPGHLSSGTASSQHHRLTATSSKLWSRDMLSVPLPWDKQLVWGHRIA